jgi:hypothetical protein
MAHTLRGWAWRARRGARITAVATAAAVLAAVLGPAAPASAAPARCWPTPGPAQYSGTPAASILFWGRYDCSKSVDWIDIHVRLERDGIEIFRLDRHATRLPGNGLVNVVILWNESCVTGGYRVTVTGSAPGNPPSGATGPTDFMSCGPVFPARPGG